MSNVGELDRVRRFLRDHPHLHKQSTHACGTVGCIAGWTVALDLGAGPGTWIAGVIYNADIDSTDDYAGRLLGLSADEQEALFYDTLTYGCGGLGHLHTPEVLSRSQEEEALLLIDTLIARDKGELTDPDRDTLARYGLPTEPALDMS